jgi:hypothetical protein
MAFCFVQKKYFRTTQEFEYLFFTVEWMIANPPIIFGKTAQLSCVTPHISSNKHNATSWLGGKD